MRRAFFNRIGFCGFVRLTTFTEVQQTLSRITERVSTPVIVDADTGFGNALNVMRTVKGFERAGVSMI